MKPNSCTEKAPTDVSPNQEMPVKKHTCTKNSRPRGPVNEPWWRQDSTASCKHTPELTHTYNTAAERKLARQGLNTLPTARMKSSQERSTIHFVTLLLSGQIYRTDCILKENPRLVVQGPTVVT